MKQTINLYRFDLLCDYSISLIISAENPKEALAIVEESFNIDRLTSMIVYRGMVSKDVQFYSKGIQVLSTLYEQLSKEDDIEDFLEEFNSLIDEEENMNISSGSATTNFEKSSNVIGRDLDDPYFSDFVFWRNRNKVCGITSTSRQPLQIPILEQVDDKPKDVDKAVATFFTQIKSPKIEDNVIKV